MLGIGPPGYYSGSTNRQTIRGLGAPGPQYQSITPGINRLSALSPFGQAGQYGSSQSMFNSPMPGTSSYSALSSLAMPSYMPMPAPMGQYTSSNNRSTLLRTLLGRKYNG